ncbi:hypothetical protein [Iodidimonas sp. SYSU 1G8]|uniref:hypothetical protein n=1 Tax=Iodidimonas sp. SYSU 1G8 TaxID=3133967 RepID=UPI0031FEAB8A
MTDSTARSALAPILTPDNDNVPVKAVRDGAEGILAFPQRAARRAPVMRRYVDREMTLQEMLADPIVRAVMARDGVTEAAIHAALERALPVS